MVLTTVLWRWVILNFSLKLASSNPSMTLILRDALDLLALAFLVVGFIALWHLRRREKRTQPAKTLPATQMQASNRSGQLRSMNIAPPLVMAVPVIVLLLVWFGSVSVNQSGSSSTVSTNFGVQTKTSGCQAHNGLPDSACTPGALLSTGTKDAICKSGYAKSVRNVPDSEKNQVYAEYGITSHAPGQYEVDHLVSLELGGSNDIANLWPELASPKPGFHEKDMVENYLHDQVCSGAISLQQAQTEIAMNWLTVYNQMPNK